MRIRKRYAVIAIALSVAVSAFGGLAVQAQEGEAEELTNVRLWLYPEYDDARLLLMMEGEVMGVDPPATIRFLVPSGAEMFAAGWLQGPGQTNTYKGGPPERKPSSIPGWDEISYEMQTGTFRMEYYHDAIVGSPDKTIQYELRPLYPISDLTVYVQEPRASSNYQVEGQGTSRKVLTDGFQNEFPAHLFSYLDVPADEVMSFDISYTRSDPTPSGESAPLSNDSGTPAEGTGSGNGLAIGIAVAALAGLGVGAYWVYQNRQARASTRASRRRAATRAAARAARRQARARPRAAPSPQRDKVQQGGRKPRFCTSCGEALESGVRFCPGCGSRV